MAWGLDFLSQAGNFAGPLASIINAIHGPDKPRQLPVPPGEAQAQSLYAALAQPDNSLVKSITDTNTRQGMNALQQQMTGQQLADRREVAMGRAPTFFDPERADQTISYMTTRGAPDIASRAHIDALNQILASAQGTGGFSKAQTARDMNYQTQIGAYQNAQAQDPRLTPAGRMGTGNDALQKILGMFSMGGGGQAMNNAGMQTTGPYQSYFPNSNQSVNWNPATSKPQYGPYQNPNIMRYSQ